MAHEVETMAYANQVPWHGLGARVDGDIKPEEMLKAAGLDWEVRKLPMSFQDDGETHEVPGRYALVRSTDKRVLTVCGQSWKPLQNSDVLGFMKNYVQAGGASLETAGSLRGGKVVWSLAQLNHSFNVGRGDKVQGYLLLTSPHEVGKAITARTTTVRVVCANTMAMANRSGNGETQYRQNHLTEFDVEAAKTAIGEAHEQLAQAERNAKILAKLKITAEDAVRKVIVPVFQPEIQTNSDVIKRIMEADVMPKRVAAILESVEHSPGARPNDGWGVLNGITHYCDHVGGREADTRMFRSWAGDYAGKKLEAEKILLDMAA